MRNERPLDSVTLHNEIVGLMNHRYNFLVFCEGELEANLEMEEWWETWKNIQFLPEAPVTTGRADGTIL
jgi:hypothetical protein